VINPSPSDWTFSLPVQASSSPPGTLKIAEAVKTKDGIGMSMKDENWNLLFTVFDRGPQYSHPPTGGMTGRFEGF
jgi:hypothetical protein